MIRRFLTLAAIAILFAGTASTQPPKTPVKELPPGQKDPEPVFQPTVRELAVHAKAAPVPRLRYQLLPPIDERQRGNAALFYNRAGAFYRNHNDALRRKYDTPEKRDQFFNKDDEKLGEMLQKPRADIPLDIVRPMLEERISQRVLKELRRAALCDHCDWGNDTVIGQDHIASILTELEYARAAAAMLKYQARLHTLEGKTDEAFNCVRDGFVLAKRVGEGGTLINMLVGIAIEAIMQGELEFLIRHPASPNFYWALADLPIQFIEKRSVMEGESRGFRAMLAPMRECDKGPIPEAKAQELFLKSMEALRKIAGDTADATPLDELGTKAGLAAMIPLQQEASKKILRDSGKSDKEIDALAPTQRYLLAEYYVCQDLQDEMFVCFQMPAADALKALDKLDEKLKKRMAESRSMNPLRVLLVQIAPAIVKAMHAHVRMERLLAMAKAVEALRLHAAKAGRFPATLAEVEVVVPNDPQSGKPIEYRLEGDKAVLVLPPPPGEKPNLHTSYRYELTLVK